MAKERAEEAQALFEERLLVLGAGAVSGVLMEGTEVPENSEHLRARRVLQGGFENRRKQTQPYTLGVRMRGLEPTVGDEEDGQCRDRLVVV